MADKKKAPAKKKAAPKKAAPKKDAAPKATGRPRNVVKLKYLEELSVVQVAKRVGKSVGAVEMVLVRARRALRDCIDRQRGNAMEVIQ